MQDDDIPVLTNVHGSLKPSPARQSNNNASLQVSSDVVAQIVAEIKPQLMGEIEAEITPKIRERLNETLIGESANIQKANQAYLSSAINQQYEKKVALVDQKLEAMQATITENLSGLVAAGVGDFEAKTNANLLTRLNDEVESARESLTTKIEQTVDSRVNEAVKQAQESVMTDTASFVDKRKADMATELPAMMHANADIVKQDLAKEVEKIQAKTTDVLNNRAEEMMPEMEKTIMARLEEKLAVFEDDTVESMTKSLTAQMADLQVMMFQEHQTNLQAELAKVYTDLTEQTKGALDSHVLSLQAVSEDSLQNKLAETFPSLYDGLSNNLLASLEQDINARADETRQAFKTQIDADLPDAQAIVGNKVDSVLAEAVPKLEAEISQNVRAEVQKIVESVRLVFNQEG